MTHPIQQLAKRGLINPPGFVVDGSQYLTITGSHAYGTNRPDSDFDIMGFCMPTKETVFPHLAGEIEGFGRQKKRFTEWSTGENGHVFDPDAAGGRGREYEFRVYSIIKFFQLCMDNNPNMLDLLFTPLECVVFSTRIGDMVRDRRKIFLHKGCWHKFKGYAFSQMKKMESKDPEPDSKRAANRAKYGFDTKFAAHTLRLMYECEQILETGDMDLRHDQDELKAAIRGEMQPAEIKEKFVAKEKYLERLYETSTLQYSPDVPLIRSLLMECLEEYYGNLDKCVVNPDAAWVALGEIATILQRSGVVA